jgi:hypothetical protein
MVQFVSTITSYLALSILITMGQVSARVSGLRPVFGRSSPRPSFALCRTPRSLRFRAARTTCPTHATHTHEDSRHPNITSIEKRRRQRGERCNTRFIFKTSK